MTRPGWSREFYGLYLCCQKTVARYVAVREAGGDPLAKTGRPRLIDAFTPKVEELVDRSKGRIRADVLVGDWLPGSGHRARLPGSLLVGIRSPAGLELAGSVGTGLAQAALGELALLLSGLEQPASPFTGSLPPSITRYARWVHPALAAEVAYLERTPSGRLRYPVWRGLRT